MNLLDITLIAETIMPNNVEAISTLLEENLKEENLEVLSLVDISVIQKELSTGNNVTISRFCFEHPAKMIKTEVEEYSEKASNRLKILLEELISSDNKVFSINSSIIKFN
jgi:hypothetical protein